MSLNKTMLIGHLGATPEVKFLASGIAVVNLSVATKEYRKNAWVTEWHRVVVFGKIAENVGKYLKKGSQLYIEGRLQTKSWQDNSGNKRYTTEIIADNIQFLSTQKTTNKEEEKVENEEEKVENIKETIPF